MSTPYLEQLPDSMLPKEKIRLAFFDVDGTLLDAQGGLPNAIVQAIKRIQRLGVKTAFATGRPSFAVAHLQKFLQFDAPGVFYTGALCADGEHLFADHHLARDAVLPLIVEAKKRGLYIEVYYRDHYSVETVTDIGREHARQLAVAPQLGCCSNWPADPIYKVLLGVDLRHEPEGLATIEKAWPSLHFAYAHLPSRPHWQFASVVAGSVDKAHLFRQLLDFHGCAPEQVIAFGDGASDCVFLREAGVGVAMANASAAVQACANFVTRSSSDLGVAYALERLV